MTMTDPIADMLTRLRNANQAYHDSAVMPSSKLKTHIAEILQQEGYIAGWNVSEVEKDGSTFKQLQIDLKYGPNRERSIAGVRRVSKPGLRVYAKSTSLPKVLGGLGVAIISTSTGLLTDKQANKKGVGGEVLAYVWQGSSEDVTDRTTPDRRARWRGRRHRRPDGQRQGPQGLTEPHRRGAHHRPARRGRHAAGAAAQRRASEPRTARPVAHPHRQHDHRRHRGVHQDPRDRRCRLPRPGTRCGPRVRSGLQPPGAGEGPRGDQLRRRVAHPPAGHGHRQAAGG